MSASSKILSHRPALCNIVRRFAQEAGELLLEYYDGARDLDITQKEDGTPVTNADQHAERLLEERLLDALPDIPVVGEESFEAGKRINFSDHEYFWLIDPLDGTRAFIAGDPDFTVNVGLIHAGNPVLGVIYAPEQGEMYAGYCDDNDTGRAFRYYEDSDTEKDIHTRSMPSQGLTVMSGNHGGSSKQDALIEQFKIKKILRRHSSIKICAVANGKADLYPRFGPTCEWDTAAGHAILKAAGGDIRDFSGKSLTYGGHDPKLLNPHFIAASNDFFDCAELDEG